MPTAHLYLELGELFLLEHTQLQLFFKMAPQFVYATMNHDA